MRPQNPTQLRQSPLTPARVGALLAQTKGPLRVAIDTSQSQVRPPALKTSFVKASCTTCQGAKTAWAPGSALQCSPSTKMKASLLEHRIPFMQHPMTADLTSLISFWESGAAAL
eukprot:14753094-Heterocapsa_arctica.AAC.1